MASVRTIYTNVDESATIPSGAGTTDKMLWISPSLVVLSLSSAKGTDEGFLCDNYGSASPGLGHDYCFSASGGPKGRNG